MSQITPSEIFNLVVWGILFFVLIAKFFQSIRLVPTQSAYLDGTATHDHERRITLVRATDDNTGMRRPVELERRNHAPMVTFHKRPNILKFHLCFSLDQLPSAVLGAAAGFHCPRRMWLMSTRSNRPALRNGSLAEKRSAASRLG